MPNKYLIVFDTVVLLQSVISPTGAAAKCFDYFDQGKILVALSRATLREVQDVLSRPEIRQRFQHITDEKVAWLVDLLLDEGLYLRMVPQHFTYPRDPKDEPQLNLAIEVRADYIISRDPDLLDLMDWGQEAGRDFQRQFRFLKIVTPEEFLRVMEPPTP